MEGELLMRSDDIVKIPMNIDFAPMYEIFKKVNMTDKNAMEQMIAFVRILYLCGMDRIRVLVSRGGLCAEVTGTSYQPFTLESERNLPVPPYSGLVPFSFRKRSCTFYLDGRTEWMVENVVTKDWPKDCLTCEYRLKKEYTIHSTHF